MIVEELSSAFKGTVVGGLVVGVMAVVSAGRGMTFVKSVIHLGARVS